MARIVTITTSADAYGVTDADRWQQFSDQCGGDQPIRDALGYLSLWNWSSFPHVNIAIMGKAGDMELTALYRKDAEGPATYVIGAVWHEDHFGYHS